MSFIFFQKQYMSLFSFHKIMISTIIFSKYIMMRIMGERMSKENAGNSYFASHRFNKRGLDIFECNELSGPGCIIVQR